MDLLKIIQEELNAAARMLSNPSCIDPAYWAGRYSLAKQLLKEIGREYLNE